MGKGDGEPCWVSGFGGWNVIIFWEVLLSLNTRKQVVVIRGSWEKFSTLLSYKVGAVGELDYGIMWGFVIEH